MKIFLPLILLLGLLYGCNTDKQKADAALPDYDSYLQYLPNPDTVKTEAYALNMRGLGTDSCETCPNNFSVILRAKGDFANCSCTNYTESYIEYQGIDSMVQKYFSPSGPIGSGLYATSVSLGAVCVGSEITLHVCTYGDDEVTWCNVDCLAYDIMIKALHDPVWKIDTLCSMPQDTGCVNVPLGTFGCCYGQTKSCVFNFYPGWDDGLEDCEECPTTYCH